MKKFKLTIIALSIGLVSFVSYGFSDYYFEVSKNLDIFSTLFKELNTYYVDETEPGELMKTAIDEMLQSLDPYTNYIPESQIEDYKFMTTGQYGGIGALIHKYEDVVIISEPYEGFPAFKAGLRAGDQIFEIDGKSVKGKNTSQISDFLKGQAGTTVKILVDPIGDGENKTIEVVRENIKVDDVPYYAMLNDEVGYIKLISFTQTASQEYKKAFNELKDKGMKKLVFDLRGNGGGLLMEAVKIVNSVVPKGSKIVETKGKLEEWQSVYTAQEEPIDTEIPLVVLVDGNSASASEIVSGALQDYDRAVILGQQTFGKGLVQQTRPLSYNAQLKVTVAKYYIPSGRCIQKIDYFHKNKNGKAQNVPDSLISSFKTLVNKREVFDGKGIKPDVKMEQETLSKIATVLLQKHHIFNYATEYRLAHDSIVDPLEFELSEEEYIDFLKYLSDKSYEYSTRSEELLKEVKETAENEEYYQRIDQQFRALEEKIAAEKKDDLKHFKDEIKQVLENEIVSRYYFQNGRIAQSLNEDPDVQKAIEILKDEGRYHGILAGKTPQQKGK
ncbi:MAG: peptidase S41 [Flavobacteriales bacterium]|nr:peptidase S41 [Flavobacteriales bacterium]